MTLHKLTAGDGYLYLMRHVAKADADPHAGPARGRDVLLHRRGRTRPGCGSAAAPVVLGSRGRR